MYTWHRLKVFTIGPLVGVVFSSMYSKFQHLCMESTMLLNHSVALSNYHGEHWHAVDFATVYETACLHSRQPNLHVIKHIRIAVVLKFAVYGVCTVFINLRCSLYCVLYSFLCADWADSCEVIIIVS